MFATWSATWATDASLSWTGGRTFSLAMWRSRTFRRGTGARASCATCTAAMAGTSCVPAEQSIYHAGDTAYFDGFREIGERLKPEVALLPIGAYHPDSFRRVHTSPEDAVQAFLDLGARWMVPMHYGTFRLSYEPVDEPVAALES